MKSCSVFLARRPENKILVGHLRYEVRGRNSFCTFQYDPTYLEQGDAFALDPLQLPLSRAPQAPPEGFALFNALRDAAPDAWGRFILEKLAGHPLDEFDFLVQAGPDRVGALLFEDLENPQQHTLEGLDLDELQNLLSYYESPDVLDARWREHLARGSSLGGARPKATVRSDGKLWLAKFGRAGDRFNVVRAEFATMELARACGLEVPEVRLASILGTDVYFIERFDRTSRGASQERIPFLSALTVLGAHESESPRWSYSDIVSAIRKEGVNIRSSSRELFKRAAFNVLVNNTDDHLRNHGFLRRTHGWVLSPLYDVVPFPEVASERFLALGLGAQGRRATLANLMSDHASFGIDEAEATELLGSLVESVSAWRPFFQERGVGEADCRLFESAIFRPESYAN
jgi:serine/threonine-protein kinase HipA